MNIWNINNSKHLFENEEQKSYHVYISPSFFLFFLNSSFNRKTSRWTSQPGKCIPSLILHGERIELLTAVNQTFLLMEDSVRYQHWTNQRLNGGWIWVEFVVYITFLYNTEQTVTIGVSVSLIFFFSNYFLAYVANYCNIIS